jgi:hypothetical protein
MVRLRFISRFLRPAPKMTNSPLKNTGIAYNTPVGGPLLATGVVSHQRGLRTCALDQMVQGRPVGCFPPDFGAAARRSHPSSGVWVRIALPKLEGQSLHLCLRLF